MVLPRKFKMVDSGGESKGAEVSASVDIGPQGHTGNHVASKPLLIVRFAANFVDGSR